MARSRSVFLYCMAAALHNPALSSLSSRDAGSRYADLSTAENPNLPSVSPFRRMMDDAGRPTGDSLSWLLFSREGRVLAGTTLRTNRVSIFSPRLCFYDARDINTCIISIFFILQKLHLFITIKYPSLFMSKSRNKNIYI